MSFTYGFYNSLRGDRKYDAVQVSELFDGILKDGIIPSYGQLFDVNTASNGMQITVGTGRAWFDHTWSKNDSVMVLTVPQSDITRGRYDTVVIEVNHEEAVRANAIKIVQGEPAVNPVKPTLVNTDKIKQYPLAHIMVKAATEEIKAEDIENMVGRTPTVFATGILETVAIDDLWSQWEGEWRTWFEGIKLQLSGDIVTNLQLQIDRLKDRIDVVEYKAEKAELISRGYGKVLLKMQLEDGRPVYGITITDLLATMDGSPVSTSVTGSASGYAKAGAHTFIPDKYVDLKSTESYTIVAGEIYNLTITVKLNNFVWISASKVIQFSQFAKRIAYTIGGGGGGGAKGYLKYTTESSGYVLPNGGGGGGGGNVVSGTANITPGAAYSISIGAGGAGGSASSSTPKFQQSYGNTGSSSSFMGQTATGGGYGGYPDGGSGSGNGGRGGVYNWSSSSGKNYVAASNGESGTQKVYTSYEVLSPYGGGGAGGYAYATEWASSSENFYKAGGSPGGANNTSSLNGVNGYGGGGAGGKAQGQYTSESTNNQYGDPGGKGGSGVVSMCIYFS